MNEPKPMGKPFDIDKGVVLEAYRRVAVNKGAPGVDEVSVSEFAQDLKGNLYKIWNRLSSGTYFPPAGAGGGDPQAVRVRSAGAGRADGGGIVPRRPVMIWVLFSSRIPSTR
jgi:hypothetical protein